MTVDGEHDGHMVIRLNGSSGHEDVAVIGCMDCLTIMDRVFLCEYPTYATGKPCRHAVQAPDGRCDLHTDAAIAARKVRSARPLWAVRTTEVRSISSPSEIRWLTALVTKHGEIEDGIVTLTGIKPGQAAMLEDRYGGTTQGTTYNDWQWRCGGLQAKQIIAAVGTDGRGE